MKKHKKIFAFVFAFVLVFTNIGTNVYLGEITNESYEYEVVTGEDGEETVTITAYTGSSTSVTIPSEIDGKTVTSIGRLAFSDCYDLTEIIIPESVTSIGDYAFAYCYALTEMTIPESVTSIGDYVFYNSYKLTEITIPESVTSIGYGAFYACSGLTELTIPSSVTSIGTYAFSYCNNLETIIVAEENENYDSREDCNAIIETNTQTLIQGCNNSTIPEDVTSIGAYAFSNCYDLTEIIIPEGVMSIGDSAFYGCSGLTELTIPSSVTSIGKEAFSSCNNLEKITVAKGNENYESREDCNAIIEKNTQTLMFGCKNSTIPEGVTRIERLAFLNCYDLTEIIIPESVTSIGYGAFYVCNSLKELTIPSSVTSIEKDAFYACQNLNQILILNNDITIGEAAFERASTELTIYCDQDSNAETYAKNHQIRYCNSFNMVTATAQDGGSISPSGNVMIEKDKPSTFTITPNENYYISDVKVDGVSVGTPSSYTIEYDSESTSTYRTIEACFAEKQTPTITVESSYTKTFGEKAFSLNAIVKGVEGFEAYNETLLYEVDDLDFENNSSDVVSVDENGTVTILGAGTATITITAPETTYYNESQKNVTITVNPKELEVVSVTADDRNYDTTKEVTITGVTLTGIVSGTDVSVDITDLKGTLNSPNTNHYTTVTFSKDLTLVGNDAKNYTLIQPTGEVTVDQGVSIKPITSDIGTVTANTLNDTLDVSEVVLERTDKTIAGTLRLKENTTLVYGTNTCEWQFIPTDSVNYTKLEGSVEIVVNDMIFPTAQYQIETNGWKNFINTITFGFFCKDTQEVEITYSDNESGLAKQQYYISNTELSETELLDVAWQNYTDKISLEPVNTYFVYVLVEDCAGNKVIMNSEGIVIYQDSEALTTQVAYTYKSDSDTTVEVNLNGNTIKEIKNGEMVLRKDTDYTIDANGTITLKASYLQTLLASEEPYVATISYYPQGIAFETETQIYARKTNSQQEEPKTTTFELQVNPAELTIKEVVATNKVYDGTTDVVITEVLLNGIATDDTVSVEITDVVGILNGADAGTYNVITLSSLAGMKLIGEDANNYRLVSSSEPITANVIIAKAQNAPNMPENAINVSKNQNVVSDVTLPNHWQWQEMDKDAELAFGETITATAVYIGADKGNYETITVLVTLTKPNCDHTETEVRNVKEATCTQTGYTGDTYCKDCETVIEAGTSIETKEHAYTSQVTKEPTVTEEGIRTYTCTHCNDSYTETIEKLPQTEPESPKDSENQEEGTEPPKDDENEKESQHQKSPNTSDDFMDDWRMRWLVVLGTIVMMIGFGVFFLKRKEES